MNSLFDEFDICAFLHEQSYSYFVKESPLRFFITKPQNLAVCCIKIHAKPVSVYFYTTAVLCFKISHLVSFHLVEYLLFIRIFQEGRIECFVISVKCFFFVWIYVMSYLSIVQKSITVVSGTKTRLASFFIPKDSSN